MPAGVYKRTKGHIKNMSLAQKGKTNIGKHPSPTTEFKKGQRASPKTEYKKGQRPVGNEAGYFKCGEQHPLWKGGVTPENIKARHSIEYRLWREAVFARDNWTCQYCKIKWGE